MQSNSTVDRGPDDRPAVRSLKVAPHNLVQLSVAQHHALEVQASRPQEIDGLLVLVGESERVVVPPELHPFQGRAVAGNRVDQVVHVDLDGHAIGRSQDEDARRL